VILNPLETFSDSISKSELDYKRMLMYAVQKLASGESKNLHETLLAVERAEIAFKTMNQIRGKVIDAYKEIMKMQV
jgi:flagellar hook-basal body complex protein FliE